MFGNTIICDAQRQVTDHETVTSSKTRYYTRSSYLQVLKRSEQKLQRKPGEGIVFRCLRAANSVVSDGI